MVVADPKFRATASQLCEEFTDINKYLKPFGYSYNLPKRTQENDVFAQANDIFDSMVNNFRSNKDIADGFDSVINKYDPTLLLSVIDCQIIDCSL